MNTITYTASQQKAQPEVGSFFRNPDTDEVYILHGTNGGRFTAICLNDGTRWLFPTRSAAAAVSDLLTMAPGTVLTITTP